MKLFRFSVLSLSLATLMLMSSCDKEDMNDDMMPLKSMTINYEFNNGQVVSSAPYQGEHPDWLQASMELEELSNGKTEISITLMNTVDGAVYNIHAHDMADPSTTPNGTPYNESPNADVLVKQVMGNGGSVMVSQITDLSYEDLTMNYDGFFVIHDPLQPMSTVDLSTYVVLGVFAREQTASGLMSMEFSYDFNTGQIDPSLSYSGNHPGDLSGMIRIQELADDRSRVSVMLDNTLNGEMYPVHAHDKADPSTTPNGTPYNEAPNSDVLVQMISGNGGKAMVSQISTMSLNDLTNTYEAFFVVHDPLQPMTTLDPTTYVILGNFAR